MGTLSRSLGRLILFIGAMVATQDYRIYLFDLILEKIFQSPFHRGTHCYRSPSYLYRIHFQSAFHRGIRCYAPKSSSTAKSLALSVPFSSGIK